MTPFGISIANASRSGERRSLSTLCRSRQNKCLAWWLNLASSSYRGTEEFGCLALRTDPREQILQCYADLMARRFGAYSWLATGASAVAPVVTLVVLEIVLMGCTSSANAHRSPVRQTPQSTTLTAHRPAETTTSTSIQSAPTTAAKRRDVCPPGCSLSSDHDAITVLAASATLVAIVTTHGSAGPVSAKATSLTVDDVLQDNYGHRVYGSQSEAINGLIASGSYDKMINGKSYLVFMSSNRGGACISALFSYAPAEKMATLLASHDGWSNDQISIPGRVLRVPAQIRLDEIRSRMEPTGGEVVVTDFAESFCPG